MLKLFSSSVLDEKAESEPIEVLGPQTFNQVIQVKDLQI